MHTRRGVPFKLNDHLPTACPQVHTRRGVPFKLNDLEHVSAAKAAAVILLHPDQVGAMPSLWHQPLNLLAPALIRQGSTSSAGVGGGCHSPRAAGNE